MDVLIIGGTQYFGKVIVRKLLDRGDNVTVFSRGNTRPEFWDDVEHINGDRTDYIGFIQKLKGRHFDAVIDNVAFHVEDVMAVEDALGGRTDKYLVASTVSIYGGPGHAVDWAIEDYDRPAWQDEYVDLGANCPIPEESVDPLSVEWDYVTEIAEYGQGKRQIERFLTEAEHFPSVVLRVPATLGPEDHTLRFWWYMQRILDGRELMLRDGGTNLFRVGFRDDVAQAFIDAMDSPKTVNQIYNVCQAEVCTLKRFLEVVAEACGVELNTVSVPGHIAESHERLPWSDWSFDPLSRPASYVMAIEKAWSDFNMQSTPMAEWIGQTVDWYRENHDGRDSRYYDRRNDEVSFALWWQQKYGHFIEELPSHR